MSGETADFALQRSTTRTPRAQAVGELSLATAAVAAYNVASIGVFVLVPIIRNEFGLTPMQIGFLASTQFAVAGVCTFPSARLADRFDAGALVGASQLVIVLALAVAAVAPSVGVILLASALLGLSSALLNPVANVLSVGIVPMHWRGLAMSVKQTGVTIGGMLAAATLPAIASVSSWRSALALPAVVATGVAVWGFRTRAKSPPQRLVISSGEHRIGRVRIATFGFIMSGVQLALFGYLAIYLVDERQASTHAAGIALAITLAAGGVGRLAWGLLSDRLWVRTTTLRVVACGSALSLAAVPVVSHGGLWPVLVLIGVCSVGWNGVYHAMVAESAGPTGVARATAFAFAFLYAGSIVVPPLLGLSVEVVSWDAFWWIAATAAVISATMIAWRGTGNRPALVSALPNSATE